jgi:hypothetical protein
MPELQVTCGIPILVVWYDINCKFGGFFMRWAQLFAHLAGLLRSLQTKFPLPGFHKYCHKYVDLAAVLVGASDCRQLALRPQTYHCF